MENTHRGRRVIFCSLMLFIVACALKLFFFTDLRRPALLPRLEGCFVTSEKANPHIFKIDHHGNITAPGVNLSSVLKETKEGYFLVTSARQMQFAPNEDGLVLEMTGGNGDVQVNSSFDELGFYKSDGGRLVFTKHDCPG